PSTYSTKNKLVASNTASARANQTDRFPKRRVASQPKSTYNTPYPNPTPTANRAPPTPNSNAAVMESISQMATTKALPSKKWRHTGAWDNRDCINTLLPN